jgi:teichuronic acid biosynthesis glycosyltransferase TuaH
LTKSQLKELVVLSLEGWDEVWRRNQFLVDALLHRNPDLRVLFVEPSADPLHDLSQKRWPSFPHTRAIGADRRLTLFSPIKPLPRRVGRLADVALRRQVLRTIRRLGFSSPALWINDVTYAPLISETGWPSLYDVTDDWLLADAPSSETKRLRRLDEIALRTANEVVVCSRALAASRGAKRAVSLVPNGVDVEHFRRPRSRPLDLPAGPVAVYVGSLHDARLDVDLIIELGRALPHVAIVFVGPNSLAEKSRRVMRGTPNVKILGPRPYDDVPAYLQHADVVIVPHRISAFTESLDPIKAYECLAIGTPTVATRVAGFRELSASLNVASREQFISQVEQVLASPHKSRKIGVDLPTWRDRAVEFETILRRAAT